MTRQFCSWRQPYSTSLTIFSYLVHRFHHEVTCAKFLLVVVVVESLLWLLEAVVEIVGIYKLITTDASNKLKTYDLILTTALRGTTINALFPFFRPFYLQTESSIWTLWKRKRSGLKSSRSERWWILDWNSIKIWRNRGQHAPRIPIQEYSAIVPSRVLSLFTTVSARDL